MLIRKNKILFLIVHKRERELATLLARSQDLSELQHQ